MDNELLTILHTIYKYKPKGCTNYVAHYFENSLSDVKILKEDRDARFGKRDLLSLTEFLCETIDSLDRTRNKACASYTIEPDVVLANGQVIFETDRRRLVVGDGVTRYADLVRFVPESGIGIDTHGTYTGDVDLPDYQRQDVDVTDDIDIEFVSGSFTISAANLTTTEPSEDGVLYIERVA